MGEAEAYSQQLLTACDTTASDLRFIRHLLQNGADPSYPNFILFYFSSKITKLAKKKKEKRKKININRYEQAQVNGNYIRSPIHAAIERKNWRVVKYLIYAGADVKFLFLYFIYIFYTDFILIGECEKKRQQCK